MTHLLKMKPELEIGYLICDLGSHLIPTHSDLRFDFRLGVDLMLSCVCSHTRHSCSNTIGNY